MAVPVVVAVAVTVVVPTGIGMLGVAVGNLLAVGLMAFNGNKTKGCRVGVKKRTANASLVNTLSSGVDVAVYLGIRMILACGSGPPP